MTESIDLLAAEADLWKEGFEHVAGADEAGRGALAGPLIAAAVILPRQVELEGLTDSKLLKRESRERLYGLVRDHSLCFSYARKEPDEIDNLGMQRANIECLTDAVKSLQIQPHFVLSDHYLLPALTVPHRGIDKGDATCRCIAAASVVAKVTRDALMLELDEQYPEYGFADNKGYGTAYHLRALEEFGPSPVHRYSFRNVGQMRLG